MMSVDTGEERIQAVNGEVLRQCREQFGLDTAEAVRLSGIEELSRLEKGEQSPTCPQVCNLSDLYRVPTWTFLEKAIPREFRFQETQAFRALGGQQTGLPYRVRRLVRTVSDLREHLLELCRQQGTDASTPFKGPAEHAPGRVREWLGVSLEEQIEAAAAKEPQEVFRLWRNAIEEKEIFVFMTQVHPHWSEVGVSQMRGLSLFHETLPVIVVNGSDSPASRTVALLHELSHVLARKTFLDVGDCEDFKPREELKPSHQLAADLLLPREDLKSYTRGQQPYPGGLVETACFRAEWAARHFGVSPLVAAVQMCRMEEMEWTDYLAVALRESLTRICEAREQQKRLPRRLPPWGMVSLQDTPGETLDQFGRFYTGSVMRAYYDKEITLHKLCGILSLSKARYAGELERLLMRPKNHPEPDKAASPAPPEDLHQEEEAGSLDP